MSIDLSYVEQIAEYYQTEFIALALKFIYLDSKDKPAVEKAEEIVKNIEKNGFLKFKNGNLAKTRVFEVMAAINRLRGIKVE